MDRVLPSFQVGTNEEDLVASHLKGVSLLFHHFVLIQSEGRIDHKPPRPNSLVLRSKFMAMFDYPASIKQIYNIELNPVF